MITYETNIKLFFHEVPVKCNALSLMSNQALYTNIVKLLITHQCYP